MMAPCYCGKVIPLPGNFMCAECYAAWCDVDDSELDQP